VYTAANTVGDFLNEQNVVVNSYDSLTPASNTPITTGMQINIARGFEVTISLDGGTGGTAQKMSPQGTLGQFVTYYEKLTGDDYALAPDEDASQTVTPGETITLESVVYKTATATASVPFNTQTTYTDEMNAGTEEILINGVNGVETTVTRVEFIGGVASGTQLLSDTVTTPPVAEVVLDGTATAVPAPVPALTPDLATPVPTTTPAPAATDSTTAAADSSVTPAATTAPASAPTPAATMAPTPAPTMTPAPTAAPASTSKPASPKAPSSGNKPSSAKPTKAAAPAAKPAVTTEADILSSLKYKEVLTMSATAYTCDYQSTGKSSDDPGFGRTASGLKAAYGVVAVDPSVIPLGAKLYIKGYGYAVAGDTGSAIKGMRIDLFLNTEWAYSQFGRQTIKVYVLS
jgi:3D (Asp-Asp-Asp) domain-containing protein